LQPTPFCEESEQVTHREFLMWLEPRLRTGHAGLDCDDIRAVRDALEQVRARGPLQPYASRLLSLVRDRPTLDGAAVARLAAELRQELAPPRERTMILSVSEGGHDE
jgi:hypothetical protein